MTELTDEEVLDMVLSRIISDPSNPSRPQIMAMLKDRPREEVAQFAASCAQSKNLHLAPWQHAPCDIDDPEAIIARGEQYPDDDYKAALVLRKLLSRGISRFHPDPLSAVRR